MSIDDSSETIMVMRARRSPVIPAMIMVASSLAGFGGAMRLSAALRGTTFKWDLFLTALGVFLIGCAILALEAARTRQPIVVSATQVSGPGGLWRQTIPLVELDRERSSKYDPPIRRRWVPKRLYSVHGASIEVNQGSYEPEEIRRLADLLGVSWSGVSQTT